MQVAGLLFFLILYRSFGSPRPAHRRPRDHCFDDFLKMYRARLYFLFFIFSNLKLPDLSNAFTSLIYNVYNTLYRLGVPRIRTFTEW